MNPHTDVYIDLPGVDIPEFFGDNALDAVESLFNRAVELVEEEISMDPDNPRWNGHTPQDTEVVALRLMEHVLMGETERFMEDHRGLCVIRRRPVTNKEIARAALDGHWPGDKEKK